MRDFFRGWKRKAGAVTLVVGTMLMLAHVRSSYVSDFIEVGHFGGDSVVFGNTKETVGLMIVRIRHDSPSPIFDWFTEPSDATGGHTRTLRMVRKNGEALTVLGLAQYLWKCDSTVGPLTMRLIEFKLLAMVAPLTLLSAYLLLSKSRPARQPNAPPPPERDLA